MKKLVCMIMAGLGVSSAYADDAATTGAETWDRSVLGYDFPQGGGMLGDMGGLRSTLSKYGFNFGLVYTNEAATNLSGGYNSNRHVANVDQLAFLFTQDLEPLTGIPDAKIEGLITNRNRDDDLTTEKVQNSRTNFNDLTQEVYGGGSITRLGYLSFSRTFDDRKLQWRIGEINYQQTFDQIVPCDFQTLSLCGGKSAYAQTWSTWNIHTWGTTLAYAMTPAWTVKTGILEQNPTASEYARAWSFSTQGSKGILLPLEVEYKTHLNGLPGYYNLGVLFNNASQSDLYTPTGETTKTYSNTWFYWGGFNQQLTQRGGATNRGLSWDVNWSIADPRSNTIHYTASTSFRYRGLFDARPNDMTGLGVTWIDMSKHYARSQQQANELNGITDYTDPLYNPVPGHSVTVDWFYRFRPVSWLDIQPDVQYWIHPGGDSTIKNAWVLGLKAVVRF